MTSNRLAQSSENDLGGKKGNRITGFMDETDMPTHFFLVFFFTQNAIEANQKFFCTFHIELFVMIMHNLAILFFAKQYIIPPNKFLVSITQNG
jgi:hypothetical protein